MDATQTEAWLDLMEQPGQMGPSGMPITGTLSMGGDISIAGGTISGSTCMRERAFFRYMRKRFGENIHPRSMNDNDLEEYLRSIKYHPSVGLAIVARMAQRKSGWTPSPRSPMNSPRLFADYLNLLATAPCMRLVASHAQTVSCRERDGSDQVRKPTEMLRSSIDGDFDALVGRLKSIAEAACTNRRQGATDTLFAHSETILDLERVSHNIFQTRATVEWTESGKAEIGDSTLEIHALKLEFDCVDWRLGKHRQIGRRIYCDEADWLQDVETPLGAERFNLRIVAA